MEGSGISSGEFQDAKNDDSTALNTSYRRQVCESFVRIAAIVVIITIVWGLIIGCAVAPYVPNYYTTTAQNTTVQSGNLSHSGTASEDNTTSISNHSAVLLTPNCSEAFFASKGICLPRCDKWKQYPEDIATLVDSVAIISASFRLVFGVIALVASCINWRKMFSFPAVLIIHLNAAIVIIAIYALVSIAGRVPLYCGSLSLYEAVAKPTYYCSFSAFYYFVVLHTSFCWFCHVVTLFWQTMFPFQARTCKIYGIGKYLYIVVLISSLVLPTAPVIAAFATGGFTLRQFPPSVCFPKTGTILYYSLVIPMSLMTGVGTSLLAIVINEIIKRRGAIAKLSTATNAVITADKKILVVLGYFVTFCSAYFVVNGVSASANVELATHIKKYFSCEASGYNASRTCSAEKTAYEALTYPWVLIVFYILYGGFPMVTLIFILQFKSLKGKLSQSLRKQQSASTVSS